MQKEKIGFREFPAKVKYGISFTVLAWIIFFIYTIAGTGTISVFHMTMGMLVCFAILSLKKWSRIFTVLYNCFMAVMICSEFYHAFNSGKPVFIPYFSIEIISVLLFVSAAFLLMTGDVKRFFADN